MARYQRRDTQGGRFQRQNFGDLGLRAYKDQQQQVIDSLKLQAARAKEYGEDHLQSTKGVAQSEAAHRQMLQGLEQDYYENRRAAVELRGKREVEALEGKAKEYGKQAEFWKDFSTTYAKQWGELAKGASQYIGVQQAENWMERVKDEGLTSNDHEMMSALFARAINKEAKNQSKKGNHEEAYQLRQLPWLAQPYIGKRFLANQKKQNDVIINFLKSEVDPKDWAENSDEYITKFTISAAAAWGLDPKRVEVLEAVQAAKDSLNPEKIQQLNMEQYWKRKRKFDEHSRDFAAAVQEGNEESIKELAENLIEERRHLYTKDGDKYAPPNYNAEFNLRHEGSLPVLSALIDNDTIQDFDLLEKYYNILVPKENRQFQKDINESGIKENLIDKINNNKSAANAAVEGKDLASLEEVKLQIENKEFDLFDFSPDGDRAKLFTKSQGAGTRTKEYIQKQLILAKNNTGSIKPNHFHQREQLRKELNGNNYIGFMARYQSMSKEAREGFGGLFDEQKGFMSSFIGGKIATPDNVRTFAKKQTDVSGNALKKTEHSTQLFAAGAYEQTLRAHYRSLGNEFKNPQDRLNEAVKRTNDDLNFNEYPEGSPYEGQRGRGLLRRAPAGAGVTGENSTVWMAYHDDEVEPVFQTNTEIESTYRKLPIDPKSPPTPKGKLETFLKYHGDKVLTTDEVDQILTSSHRGQKIKVSDSITRLTQLMNEGLPEKIYAPRDVYNALLKSKGIKYEIPPNSVDMSRQFMRKVVKQNPKQSIQRDANIVTEAGYEAFIRTHGPQVLGFMRPEIQEFQMEFRNERNPFKRFEEKEFQNRVRGI